VKFSTFIKFYCPNLKYLILDRDELWGEYNYHNHKFILSNLLRFEHFTSWMIHLKNNIIISGSKSLYDALKSLKNTSHTFNQSIFDHLNGYVILNYMNTKLIYIPFQMNQKEFIELLNDQYHKSTYITPKLSFPQLIQEEKEKLIIWTIDKYKLNENQLNGDITHIPIQIIVPDYKNNAIEYYMLKMNHGLNIIHHDKIEKLLLPN